MKKIIILPPTTTKDAHAEAKRVEAYLCKSKGMVLIIATIFLFLLSILAISQISSTSLTTKLAANSMDSSIAFQTAEGTLKQGVNQLISGAYPGASFANNANGLYTFNSSRSAPLWTTIDWSSSTAVIQSYQGLSNTTGAYFIEKMPSVVIPGQSTQSNPTSIYRITARGVGISGGSAVILQASIQVPSYAAY